MFLISTPQPAAEVDLFVIDIDGTVHNSPPQVDGSLARLHFELPSLSFGNHTATVRAVNEWGDGQWSDPFDFVVQLPSKVSGLGLSVD